MGMRTEVALVVGPKGGGRILLPAQDIPPGHSLPAG